MSFHSCDLLFLGTFCVTNFFSSICQVIAFSQVFLSDHLLQKKLFFLVCISCKNLFELFRKLLKLFLKNQNDWCKTSGYYLDILNEYHELFKNSEFIAYKISQRKSRGKFFFLKKITHFSKSFCFNEQVLYLF